MKDITGSFGTLYFPKAALMIYHTKDDKRSTYVEYFDIDKNGSPVNAHPLSVNEARQLAKALNTTVEKKETLLKPAGIMDANVLYLDQQQRKVIWYTKAQQKKLYFTPLSGIANGIANIPPLVWIAGDQGLHIFALADNKRPSITTKLFHAPFFNVYESGGVCMGTVDTTIKKTASLEEFVSAWEASFFNSKFSHLMQAHNPINGNCVQLWDSLVGTDKPFPMEVLTPSKKTVKNFIS
ncbi:PRTRC system protein B [Niabella sp. CJ426]|uniref:PRTRC system protein B n=1 Tax=Niabella sp. CJ426 TaxID=3393740 RepID=UPI003D02FBAA